jgi:hypothetical protein
LTANYDESGKRESEQCSDGDKAQPDHRMTS